MAEVKIDIQAIDGSSQAFNAVEQHARQSAGAIGQFESATKKATSTAVEFVKGLALWETIKQAAAWVRELAAGFLGSGSAAEQYQTRLETLLGSQREGARLFQEMTQYASKVPFEFQNVMAGATQLAGVMRGGVDEIKQWMPMIGDLAAASGLSIEETTGQVIRMYSAGAGAADLFRERGILAMMGFQGGVEYSASETRKKMMEEWTKMDSQFRGATDKLAGTWEGAMSMMKDKWFQFKDAVMKAGVMDWLKAVLKTVQVDIDDAFDSGKAKQFAGETATFVVTAMEKIALGAAWVADAFRGWSMIWSLLKVGFSEYVNYVLGGVEKMIRWLRNGVDSVNFRGIFDGAISKMDTFMTKIETWRTKMQAISADSQLDLSETIASGSAVKKVEDFFGKVHKNLDEMKVKAAAAANEMERPKVLRVDMTQAIDSLGKVGIAMGGVKTGISKTLTESEEVVAANSRLWTDFAGNVMGQIVPDAIALPVRTMAQLKDEAAAVSKRLSELKMGDIRSEGALQEMSRLEERAADLKKDLAIQAEPHLKLDALEKELKNIVNAVEDTGKVIETQRTIELNTDKARAAAIELRQAIDQALPDRMEKNVVVVFQTQASPVMPFTEGMNRIRDMMESLPQGGDYTVRFQNLAAEWQRQTSRYEGLDYNIRETFSGGNSFGAWQQRDESERESKRLWQEMLDLQKAASRKPAGPLMGSYSPQINIRAEISDYQTAAREIDKVLADDIKYDRSQLLLALKQKLGL